MSYIKQILSATPSKVATIQANTSVGNISRYSCIEDGKQTPAQAAARNKRSRRTELKKRDLLYRQLSIAVLSGFGPATVMSQADMGARLDCSKSGARNHCLKMLSNGLIEESHTVVRTMMYRITAAGRAFLNETGCAS